MKVTIINGSPRKGNTYTLTQLFKQEMEACGEVTFTEFYLPQDMPKFCTGCMACFYTGEQFCPHAEYTMPILTALLDADAIIFTSPVYVLQTTGAMKAFLDHYGFMFMIHRPNLSMFNKKAFVLSTTIGAGTKAVIKTITTSLQYWGVNRIYSSSFAMRAGDWQTANPKRKANFESRLKKSARKFYNEVTSGKKHTPYLFTRMMFAISRKMIKGYDEKTSLDKQYWIEKNLFNESPF